MIRIAIIGGGTSGLPAAFELEERRRAGAEVEYVLYEATPRFGGVLRTEHIDGCVVEAGPDSFVSEKPWAADLCRVLGIGDQLIGSNDSDRNARRPHVPGADENSANRAVAALFVEDQIAHGGGTVPSAACG
jgi:protoporphyrinogen oxidase